MEERGTAITTPAGETHGLAFSPLALTLRAVSDVTQLLNAIDAGDPKAAHQLLPLVYDELRKVAAAKMAQEKPGQTLQPTALVHEAWLKIAGEGGEHFSNRPHFFKAAASAMQQILIDNARRKQRVKHGGNLEGEDPEAAEVVRMRYFVGMTVPEIATALDLAPRTVDRHWAFAPAWLKRTIRASLST